MTQEDKQLLLVDLSARLPYGVKVQAYSYEHDVETIETLYAIDSDGYMSTLECDTLDHISKPYLFPMTSMTEEQKFELNILQVKPLKSSYATPMECVTILQWCYKNHIDVSGLIPKGLAIDATGLNIY